jgi:DNA-binding response OmpR family regulator
MDHHPGSTSAQVPQQRPTLLIFHVEGDDDDRALFQIAAYRAEAPFFWHSAHSAEKAIAYFEDLLALENQGSPLPDLVVLDVIMRGQSGRAVLEYIRSHARLENLPVIMFTGSPEESLRSQALALGASSCVLKPIALADLTRLIGHLHSAYRGLKSPPPWN